jgi:hypothetical protein
VLLRFTSEFLLLILISSLVLFSFKEVQSQPKRDAPVVDITPPQLLVPHGSIVEASGPYEGLLRTRLMHLTLLMVH